MFSRSFSSFFFLQKGYALSSASSYTVSVWSLLDQESLTEPDTGREGFAVLSKSCFHFNAKNVVIYE